jgi:orotidine-5'-phosphate decarboxylase
LTTRHPREARQRIIVAMDVADRAAMDRLCEILAGSIGMAKVGKQLFTAMGPAAVESLTGAGLGVFLDLKYHDIPNTVAQAVRASRQYGVEFLTVHALGGGDMVSAACEARGDDGRPAIIAVTLLTSMDSGNLQELGIHGEPREVVERLAQVALDAGADGLVCSGREVAGLRARFGPAPVLITPGIRPAGSGKDDQARVVTPAAAVSEGADYLVIGRPITAAEDPAAVVEALVVELEDS